MKILAIKAKFLRDAGQRSSDHYKAYVKAVNDLMEEKIINKLTTIE